jgi:hypothetical protein
MGARSTAAWAFVGVVVGAIGSVAAVAYSPLGDYVRPRETPRPLDSPSPAASASAEPPAKPTDSPAKSQRRAAVAAPTAPTPTAAPSGEAAVEQGATSVASDPAPASATQHAVAARAPDAGSTVTANDEGDEDGIAARADDGSDENDHAPPPEPASLANHPAPAIRNVNDAKALIRRGDADGALAGLQRLRHARPAPSAVRSSEIATLIGDLYFDKKWWTDALREYRFAITLDARAKRNDILVNNSVRALADRTTYPRARRLLLDYVGRNAAPALKRAAKSGSPLLLRRRAQQVLATLESKSYRSRR